MKKDLALTNWGSFLVNTFIHPFTTIATPIFLLLLTVYFIAQSFGTNIYAGIRSLSGALLPLIVITFIYIFNRDLLANLGKINVLLSYAVSMIWGTVVMAVIRIFGGLLPAPFPINEIILSGSFAVLVFSYVESAQSKILSYYYGMVTGFLLYIILFGFPPNVLPR